MSAHCSFLCRVVYGTLKRALCSAWPFLIFVPMSTTSRCFSKFISSGVASLGLNWDVSCSFKIMLLCKALNNDQTIHMYLKCEKYERNGKSHRSHKRIDLGGTILFFIVTLLRKQKEQAINISLRFITV